MKKKGWKRIVKSVQARSGLLIVVVAAALVELVSVVQYLYAREGIRQEVQQRAESELRVKSLEIKNMMTSVEVALQNMAWAVEQNIDTMRSISVLPSPAFKAAMLFTVGGS